MKGLARIGLAVLLLAGPSWAMARSPLVLLTDFGTQDGAVSAMKGVAYSVSPDLLDLGSEPREPEHLRRRLPALPGRAILARGHGIRGSGGSRCRYRTAVGGAQNADRPLFRGTDNGLLSLVAERDGIAGLRRIDEARNRRPGSDDSHTFHGRDVFAYTGARLAAGVITFEEVGPPLAPESLISIPYHKAERAADSVKGIIPVVDVQFGNVWTNIPKPLFDELHIGIGEPVRVRIYRNDRLIDETVAPYQRTFGEVQVGKPLVYVNSLLNLAVALNQGSYAAQHKIDSGPDWTIELRRARDAH